MGIFSKLFSKPKPITKFVDGLGEFEFFNNGEDRYWQVERPVMNLPPEFDFGAINGDVHTIDSNAMKCFKEIAQQPDQLFVLLTDDFLAKAQPHFDKLSFETVRDEFYVKSLTTSNEFEYEFELHSRSKDIFIELFVRDGNVTEVHLDEGCCVTR